VRRMRQATTLAAVALMGLSVAFAGCGGGSLAPPVTPVTQSVSIVGQYNLVLTSTNGQGTTSIYTNFTQTGTTFVGAANTLVCPANDLSQCFGNDAPVTSINASGTVSGLSVAMTIIFPNMAGADTISMVGTATSRKPKSLACGMPVGRERNHTCRFCVLLTMVSLHVVGCRAAVARRPNSS